MLQQLQTRQRLLALSMLKAQRQLLRVRHLSEGGLPPWCYYTRSSSMSARVATCNCSSLGIVELCTQPPHNGRSERVRAPRRYCGSSCLPWRVH